VTPSGRATLEHCGGHRAQFYELFESKEDCFAQAYAAWIERLCVSVLEAAATVPGCRQPASSSSAGSSPASPRR